MSSMLDQALAYARAGLFVLPLEPQSKAPAGRLVPRGYLDATCDEATIAAWYGRLPEAGVGIALEQSGLIAVDIDPRNGGSLKGLGWRVGKTPVQVTGGGGLHILYRAPDGLRLPGKLTDGIDLKHRGYIVASPTKHPDTGRQYEWKSVRGGVLDPVGTPARDCPPELLRLAEKQRQRDREAITSGDQIPDGARSDTLTRIAGSMRRNGMSSEEMLPSLLAINEQRCVPPMHDDEVRAIALSVERYPAAPQALVASHLAGEEGSSQAAARATYLDDTGNAERLRRHAGDDYRYIDRWRDWSVWTGTRWEPDGAVTLRERAIESAELFLKYAEIIPDENARKAAIKHAKHSRNANQIKNAIELVRGPLTISTDDLDRYGYKFNTPAGTLILNRGETPHMAPHRREDYMTMLAGASYDPAADCPRWDAFIARVLPDAEVAAYVQRALGYNLIADQGEQVLFILHGSGANGKSVLLDTITSVLGDYAKQVRSQSLVMDSQTAIPSDLARLKGARMALAQETELGSRLAEGLIKTVTGERRLMARKMYADWFEFPVSFKIWLATNHKPSVKGTDQGIWRRLKLIPFNTYIPPAERIANLDDILYREEGSGILNWLVRGLYDYYEHGLNEPAVITAEVQQYQDEMDPIGSFLRETTVEEPGAYIQASQLYASYREYLEANGWNYKMTSTAFGMALAERGVERVEKRQGRFYVGLRFTHAAPTPF